MCEDARSSAESVLRGRRRGLSEYYQLLLRSVTVVVARMRVSWSDRAIWSGRASGTCDMSRLVTIDRLWMRRLGPMRHAGRSGQAVGCLERSWPCPLLRCRDNSGQ